MTQQNTRSMSNKTINSYLDTVTKVAETTAFADRFGYVAVDGSLVNSSLSVIAVVKTQTLEIAGDKVQVAFYAPIVVLPEGTPRMTTRPKSAYATQFEKLRTPAEATAVERLDAEIRRRITESTKLKDGALLSRTNTFVLNGATTEIEKAEKIDEAGIRELMWAVAHSLVTAVMNSADRDNSSFESINALKSARPDSNFTLDDDFQRGQIMDRTNMPRRADVISTLRMSAAATNADDDWLMGNDDNIGSAAIYTDFAYNPNEILQAEDLRRQGLMSQTPAARLCQFAPITVLNAVHSNNHAKDTPEQFFMIAMAALDNHATKGNWKAQLFNNRGNEMAKAGMFGLVAKDINTFEPIGAPIDLDAADVDADIFYRNLSALVDSDRMAVAFNCPYSGANSAVTDQIIAASHGGASSKAQAIIVRWLDNITSGQFSVALNNKFPEGVALFLPNEQVYFNGHYPCPTTGKLKDLSEIGLLANYTKFAEQPEMIDRYNLLHSSGVAQGDELVAERLTMLRTHTNGKEVITSYGERPFLNPKVNVLIRSVFAQQMAVNAVPPVEESTVMNGFAWGGLEAAQAPSHSTMAASTGTAPGAAFKAAHASYQYR